MSVTNFTSDLYSKKMQGELSKEVSELVRQLQFNDDIPVWDGNAKHPIVAMMVSMKLPLILERLATKAMKDRDVKSICTMRNTLQDMEMHIAKSLEETAEKRKQSDIPVTVNDHMEAATWTQALANVHVAYGYIHRFLSEWFGRISNAVAGIVQQEKEAERDGKKE